MSTSYKTINTFEKDNIFFLEINRPDKLNALNKTVLDEMLDAIKVSLRPSTCCKSQIYSRIY